MTTPRKNTKRAHLRTRRLTVAVQRIKELDVEEYGWADIGEICDALNRLMNCLPVGPVVTFKNEVP